MFFGVANMPMKRLASPNETAETIVFPSRNCSVVSHSLGRSQRRLGGRRRLSPGVDGIHVLCTRGRRGVAAMTFLGIRF
jgi:hypothetical protein